MGKYFLEFPPIWGEKKQPLDRPKCNFFKSYIFFENELVEVENSDFFAILLDFAQISMEITMENNAKP